MAMIFQACRNSSTAYLKSGQESSVGAPEKALLHQKYINHLISEFKPVLAEIIKQGIDAAASTGRKSWRRSRSSSCP